MLTIQQKAQKPFNKKLLISILWYHKLKSRTAVQRTFRNEFGQDPPHTNSIKRWFKNFMKTGTIFDRKRSGRPSIDKETVDAVRVTFQRSQGWGAAAGTRSHGASQFWRNRSWSRRH